MIDANQAGNTNYSAATQVQRSIVVNKEGQTITFTQPTTPVTLGVSPITLSASSTSNLTVAFTIDASSTGTGSISGNVLTVTGAGTLVIDANQAGNTNYSAATQMQRSIVVSQASQTITITSTLPGSASDGASFTVTATASSGLAVTFSSSGVCTITNSGSGSATYVMTAGSGTCSVIANQTGNTNYAAVTVTKTVTATSGPVISVSPTSISFGSVTVGSITTETVTVSNTGNAAATISTPLISLLKAGSSNEFVVVNLCPSSLGAGKSCTITVSFVAGAYYNYLQTATLEVMDNAPGSPQAVGLSATILEPQTITFGTVQSSASYGTSFTVAATASSGLPVTYSSSGSCTDSGANPATYTMTSGTGTCSVIANQAGNGTYAPATQVTKSVSATKATETITFTQPTTPVTYGVSPITLSATSTSGLTVMFTIDAASTGTGSISGNVLTVTGAGALVIDANQAGNGNYSAATQVQHSIVVNKEGQTITFSTGPPAAAAYKTSFTVASSASSGLAVSYTSSGPCTNSGATYTMTSGTGTCSVIASQAGNSNYSAATTVTKTTTATYSTASLTPASLSFGTVANGKSSTAQTATLKNTGTTPLIISSIGFTGSNPSNFTQTNNCPSSSSSLGAGSSCTISVTFKSGGKSATANLAVTDNTSAGTQTVSLSGN